MAIDTIVKNAAQLATAHHRGQFRKYTGRPYVEHPMRVATRIMLRPSSTDEMIAAAWLHDILEDTKCPASTIARACGLSVLELVEGLTNPSRQFSNLSRAERKLMDRNHLNKAPLVVQIIKLADRLDNLLDMDGAPADFKTLYASESRLLAKGIGHAEQDLRGEILAQCERLEKSATEELGQVA